MNREQVKTLFKQIKLSYDNFEVSSEKVNFWYSILKEHEYEIVINNLKFHVTNNVFPPRIADLVKKPLLENVVPTAEETKAYLKQMDEWKQNAAPSEVREQALADMRKILGIKG